VHNWPSSIKGVSTCFPPKYIKAKKLATNTQKTNLLNGLNVIPRNLEVSIIGSAKRTKIAPNIKITPIPLLGIERSMA
jgi:hypothetical protein